VGAAFWVRRFVVVFAGAFVVIAGVQFLKGHTLDYSVTEGLLWSVITATVFTAARIYQSRKQQHCAICRDTPEMLTTDRDSRA
jgi:hypothetical protein